MDSLLTLSEFKSFKDKRSFIASQAGLDDFQLIFFTKKTILISLGLTDYFKADFNEEVKISRGLEIIEKEKNTTNKALRSFNFKSFNKALFTTIDINNVAIGAIFVPFKSNLSNNSKNLILSFKDQIENQIKIKELEQKLINSNKELNNKTLEIESLIDVTEIINSQQGMKKDLFENLLITILSILNASKGMVLLKDEKSGFFNIISNFNLSKEELPNKIIRITKGILKELNESKSSKIVDEPLTYELLKSSKKNCIVSPIISSEFVEGVIILFDKESRQGLIKFTQKDLRLFDSLSKKVSLAYDNIRLIDSLKSSNELVDNIMSSITTGIIMINILGEIEFVNQSAKKIFSLEEEELINNHYFMAFQTNPKLIELFEKSEIQNEVIYEDNFLSLIHI